MSAPWILGIAASHNGAVCLLHGERLVVAVQEERLTRRKREWVFGSSPALAINYCLESAGIRASDLAAIGLCVQGSANVPGQRLENNSLLGEVAAHIPTFIVGHHLAHAVSAYVCSGFAESAILVVDGAGSPFEDLTPQEQALVKRPLANAYESISIYDARGREIVPIAKQVTPEEGWLIADPDGMPKFRTLGGMYSAAATQIFGDVMEAGKVMGLAALGTPQFSTADFWSLQEDGELQYLDVVPARYRHNERWPSHQADYAGLAASVQCALEDAILLLGRQALQGRRQNLCFAGGVALNGIANERLIRETSVDDLYVIPAAEDSGTAIGAAHWARLALGEGPARVCLTRDSVGRRYTADEIAGTAAATPCIALSRDADVVETAVAALERGEILGWFQGGSELGPRALGHRSILCDPRPADAKDVLNARVKHREAFRPFAPAVLLEHASDWFDMGPTPSSPFMLRVCNVRPERRHLVPAIVHADGSARVQTVSAADGRLHALLRRFFERTGVPMLLNTSFNDAGEPIVETPEDAMWCLLETAIDRVLLEDFTCSRTPEFISTLDFIPRRVSPYEDDTPLGRLFRVAHRWGTTYKPLQRPEEAQVFALVDGWTSGRQIAEQLWRDVGWSESAVKGLLRSLRSAGIIALGTERMAVPQRRTVSAVGALARTSS